MLDSEEDVEGLDQRTLSVASAAVLVPFADPIAAVVEDPIGQSRRSHVLASCEERADLVEEYGRGAFLVHAAENVGDLVDGVCEFGYEAGNSLRVISVDGVKHVQHLGDQLGSGGFDRDRHHEEPLFVLGPGERGVDDEVVRIGHPGCVRLDAEIPQADGRVGGAGWELQMSGDFQERSRDAWGQDLLIVSR